ncbi:MAG TPA: phasin family protein [Gemmatimonadaceae bacterium]|nr:phasin family protein [Gemmatimonadaceae bacterium]
MPRLDADVLRPTLHLEVLAHVVVLVDVTTEPVLLAVEVGLVVLLAPLEQAVPAVGGVLRILTLRLPARPRLPLFDLARRRLRSLLSFGVALGAFLMAAIGFRHLLPPGYRCIASRRKRVVAGVASSLEMGKKQSGGRAAPGMRAARSVADCLTATVPAVAHHAGNRPAMSSGVAGDAGPTWRWSMTQATRRNGGTQAMRESVEQVWLAGLGALALTEEEGSKFFRALVKKGEGIEKRSRARLSDTMQAARSAPSTTLTKLERQVDTTLENVMHRLGVPTRTEINSLSRRIEGLAQSMEKTPRRRRVTTSRVRKPAATDSTMVAAH